MRRYVLLKILWAVFVHCEVVIIANKDAKKSFILFLDSFEMIKRLNMEQRGHLLTAIFEYEQGEPVHDLDPLTDMAFSGIRPYLDRNRDQYNRRCEINTENGKKGGRPKKTERLLKKPNGFFENQTKANETLNENDTENENDTDFEKDIDSESESKREIDSLPTLEAIKDFIQNEGLNMDAEAFFDNYAASGWIDANGNEVKDWKAKCRNWARRERNYKPQKQEVYGSDASYGDANDAFLSRAVGTPGWKENKKER